jgi:lincosamide nucleotidyltransferase A/C/D/E
MTAAELVRLIDALEEAGVSVWLDGGWGVDVLLREQRRPHDDLDIVVALSDVGSVQDVLARNGYIFQRGAAPLSFELVDPEGRQVDVHPVTFDESGGGIYQMADSRTWVYPPAGFEGRGEVAGRTVRCLTPEVQMLVHTGYELTQKDYDEIAALHDRFGVDPPADAR